MSDVGEGATSVIRVKIDSILKRTQVRDVSISYKAEYHVVISRGEGDQIPATLIFTSCCECRRARRLAPRHSRARLGHSWDY
jgi:hypothetical protein